MSARKCRERASTKDLMQQLSGWEIVQGLRLKIAEHPDQGAREQALSCLNQIVTALGAWLLMGAFQKKESKENVNVVS